MSGVQKLVTVDADDAEWVSQNCPHGFWSWFVRLALRNYRSLHEVSPAETVREAVKGLSEKDS